MRLKFMYNEKSLKLLCETNSMPVAFDHFFKTLIKVSIVIHFALFVHKLTKLTDVIQTHISMSFDEYLK